MRIAMGAIWRRSPRSWPRLTWYRRRATRLTPVGRVVPQPDYLAAAKINRFTTYCQLTRQPGDCSEPASGSEPEHEPITGHRTEELSGRDSTPVEWLVWVSQVLAITGPVASAADDREVLSGLLWQCELVKAPISARKWGLVRELR